MTRLHATRAAAPSGVGALLRFWRRQRNLSQLALASEADVSPRHVCFLETGRAKPSREMVLHLAETLSIPLRERNALLVAAGFAPAYLESSLDAPQVAVVRTAIDAILAQQEPYPAVVMNRAWDIVTTNAAAARFFRMLLDGRTPPDANNVLRLMFHPDGLRPNVTNWTAVAPALLQRVHREAIGGVVDEGVRALVTEIMEYPGVQDEWRRVDPGTALLPVLPVSFQCGRLSFAFFSTVTILGTPQDITLQELRIESFFPADEATATTVRRLSTQSRMSGGAAAGREASRAEG